MTTTSSTVWASSARRWLETRTVRPSAARPRSSVAQPEDAGRVEAVGRLVEHEGVGVTEQRGGETQPLAHADRVPADPAPSGVGEADEVEHLVDPPVAAMPRHAARIRRASRPGARGWNTSGSVIAPTTRAGSREGGVGEPVDGGAVPAVGRVRPSSIRRVVDLPAPLAPRKPVTRARQRR